MSRIVKILISLILIFVAVPYVAYGIYKYLPDEQEDTTNDIRDAMNDVFGSLPKMDEDDFIDFHTMTMAYGLAIGLLSFIFGLIAGSKKKK